MLKEFFIINYNIVRYISKIKSIRYLLNIIVTIRENIYLINALSYVTNGGLCRLYQ